MNTYLKYALPFIAVIGMAVGFSLMQGCAIEDLVKVDVPPEVQRATGSGPRVPLSLADDLSAKFIDYVAEQSRRKQADLSVFQRKAEREIDELAVQLEREAQELGADADIFKADAERAATAFTARIARGRETADLFSGLLNDGLTAANQSGVFSAIPLGGLAFGTIGGLLGLFAPRPKEAKLLKEAEDRIKIAADQSYDLGRKEALDTIKQAK